MPASAGFLRSGLPTTIIVALAGVSLSLIKGGTAEAPISAAKMLWPIFGASNQLLASLALLAVSVWLSKPGKIAWYTVIPMAFMLVTTLTGLSWHGWLMFNTGKIFLSIVDGLLVALGLVMTARAVPRIYKPLNSTETTNALPG